MRHPKHPYFTPILGTIIFVVGACSDVSFKGIKYADLESLDAQGRAGAVLKNLPGDPSNQTALNAKVENVSSYKYALINEGKDCGGAKYSDSIAEARLITDELGDDGTKLLCVIGAKEGYSEQAKPTRYSWVKDTLPPGEFAHSGLTAIMTKSPAMLTWSKSQDASDYFIKIATNADCSDTVQNFSNIKTEFVAMNPLDDGAYYICLEAKDLAGNKTIASNSGFKFIIDQNPPSAFNINRPIRISKILNPEIQWSRSSADAVYDLDIASDAGCANIVAQERNLAVTRHRFAQEFQDMTDYHVCVYAKDAAGNTTPASNNGYKFTVNTSAIVVSFDPNTLPDDPSNTARLNVDVIGQGISAYRYKIANLPATTGAADAICANASGYSGDISINTNITDALTGDGRKIICAYGSDTAGNWPINGNDVTSFNHFEWTRATSIPRVAFDVAESCGPAKCPSLVAISNGVWTRATSSIDIMFITMSVQDTTATSPSYLQNTSGTFGAARQDLSLPIGTNQTFTFSMPTVNLINGHRYNFTVIARDLAGNASLPVTRSLVWDTTPPAFSAADGLSFSTREDQNYNTAQTTKVNFVKAKLNASDSYSKIDKYCLKYESSSTTTAPATPASTDSCWKIIPPASQATTIAAGNLPFSVPFFPDTYKMYAWVMDFAGNISARSPLATINYNPIKPPVFSHVYVTYTANDELPTTANTMAPSSGSRDVYIRWAVSTRNQGGLKDLRLHYTTNDQTYVDAGIAGFRPDVRTPSTCKLSAVNNSAAKDYAGCIKYTLPVGVSNAQFLRFRVIAEDIDDAVTFGQTNALHLDKFTFLAGNTEAGLGSTALSAIINPKGTQNIAVHSSGQIFILDDRGLLVVDPLDGAMKIHPKSSSFQNPLKIALDKNDNLLVYDGATIKKLDLNSTAQTVTTLIGGGSNTADSVANPLDLKIFTSSDLLFFAAPNGDIYFMSETPGTRDDSDHMRVRRAVESRNYAIESIVLQGPTDLFTWRTATEGPVGHYNIEDCNLISAAFTFNAAGAPTGMFPLISPHAQTYSATGGECWLNIPPTYYAQQYDYAPYRASVGTNNSVRFAPDQTLTTPPPLAFFNNNRTGIREGIYARYFQSLSGRLYARVNGVGINNDYIASFNTTTRVWDHIAGQINGGECVDGTLATQCALNLSSIFVDINNRVYMMDNDVVRVIQDDGKILTIAGESRSAGDGKNPLNARFNELAAFDIYPKNSASTKFVISDAQTMSIREFAENGIIDSVAGNGINAVNTDYSVWSSLPAKGQSLSWGNDGPNSGLVVDDAGNIIVTKIQSHIPYRINRATGKWESLTGSERVPYMATAGGGGYGAHVIGMNSTQILFGTFNYLSQKIATGNGRLYTLPTSGTMPTSISPVLSKPGADDIVRNQFEFDRNNMLCAQGTSRLNCNGPYMASSQMPQATFDAESQMWILGVNNLTSSRISGFPITSNPAADVIQDLISFPSHRVESFTVTGTLAARNKRAFVCLSNGALMKYNITATGASAGTQVAFPVPQMKCSGASGSMIYSTARRSGEGGTLIFSYELNGLQGIAEMVNP